MFVTLFSLFQLSIDLDEIRIEHLRVVIHFPPILTLYHGNLWNRTDGDMHKRQYITVINGCKSPYAKRPNSAAWLAASLSL